MEAVPPFNIQAEQELLGVILYDNKAYYAVCDELQAWHFYDPLHGRIYEACGELIDAGKAATPVTLNHKFDSEDPVGEITVPQYLGRLFANVTLVSAAADYAAVVIELAKRREIMKAARDARETAAEADDNPDAIIERLEGRLYEISQGQKFGQGWQNFSDAAAASVAMAGEAMARGEGLAGLSCGISPLDSLLGGMQPGNLIILAARPSMGKTALATNIAHKVAKAGKGVAFFSLEMSAEELATRVIGGYCKISGDKIRRGKISEHDKKRIDEVAKEYSALPLFIDQQGGLSISQICSRARRLAKRSPIGLVVIDYLQIARGDRWHDSRNSEITEISMALKALAKELAAPVLCLSQLSREVERRADRRPELADLRDSGAIEQDADVVMFIYREEYYLTKKEPDPGDLEGFAKWDAKMERCKGLAEVIVAKQRHGATGKVELVFDAEHTTFSAKARAF